MTTTEEIQEMINQSKEQRAKIKQKHKEIRASLAKLKASMDEWDRDYKQA